MVDSKEITVIITSSFEPLSIGRVINSILDPRINKITKKYEIIIVSPDTPTWSAAKMAAKKHNFKDIIHVKDKFEGKPKALNMAFKKAKGKFLVLTDGDTNGLSKNALRSLLFHFKNPKVGAVTGQPVSADSKQNFFGYLGHLHCVAADDFRLKQNKNGAILLSGYLFAMRNFKFNIPTESLAEDAWISSFINSLGYLTKYEPKAMVFVKFPKNLKDWLKQKTRSLGGNVQKVPGSIKIKRSIFEDLRMFLFPIKYAKNLKEFIWSLCLYPLRLLLWGSILYKQLIKKEKLTNKAWERVESTK